MLTATKRVFKAMMVAVITIMFVSFAVVNRAIVHLSLFPLPYSAEVPAFIFAIFCFTLGLIVGWFVISLKLSRSQRLLRSEHKRVMALQNEVTLMHTQNHGALPAVITKS